MVKAALVVPCFDHEGAIAQTLAGLKPLGLPCYVVDDGSGEACRRVLAGIAQRESSWLTLRTLAVNQGKGAAVMDGFQAALAAGYTHAVQIDADGQHEAGDVPRLLDVARAHPEAVVAGVAQYDDSVPRSRLYGRYLTHVWVWINTLSLQIRDSMCGLRVYPLAPTLATWDAHAIGRRMEFDPEILVRLHWSGVPVQSVPVRVHYPADGVSHFDLLMDNVRISWMHARLFFGMLARLPWLLARRWRPRLTEPAK
ncbi:MAG: glycosyltransferase family 2 protein [Gammaproteobacteria bacterium]